MQAGLPRRGGAVARGRWPVRGRRGWMRWAVARQVPLSLLALLLWTLETAWRLPGDACYDLLNYHLYGPFALLAGKWGVDVAPAQSQGFLPPTNDLPYYLLARWVPDVRWLHVLLAVPAAVAVGLAFLITLRLLRAAGVVERGVALVAVGIGATGAASHPVLATSMSDMAPGSLVLGAVLLLCDGGGRVVWRGLWAGLLVGVALGLKLTFACAAVGLVAAVPVCLLRAPGVRLGAAAAFCAAAGVAALATGGWWWWRMWELTGNPVFPMFNHLFHSPLATPEDWVDGRFLPRTVVDWLGYPFQWAVWRTPIVTEPEQPMRDPRFALALVAAAVLLLRGRAVAGAARFVAVFFLVAFALWEWTFSIFRYLAVPELLTGPLLAAAAFSVLRGAAARRAVLAGGCVLLVGLQGYTIYPDWGRLHAAGGRPLAVSVRTLPSDAIVLLLDPAPLSYLALFEPASVRFFGANNNLVQPGEGGPLDEAMLAAVERQAGPVFGLERPDFAPGAAEQTLRAYGLRRTACETVKGEMVGTTTWLCELGR